MVGYLSNVFEADEQNSLNAVTKEKVAEITADFMTTFYHIPDQCTGNAGISDNARSVLAYLLFGHDQRTDATNVFRRAAAGWDGC